MLRDRVQDLISIPQFVTQHVNKSINLSDTPWILCILPGHEDDKKPSFQYNDVTKRWKCWSRCKKGGRIVELYSALYGVTDEEAVHLLATLYNITDEPSLENFDANRKVDVDETKVRYAVIQNIIESRMRRLSTPSLYVRMDYIMSYEDELPVKLDMLEKFLQELERKC